MPKDYSIWHHPALHDGDIPHDQIEVRSPKTGEKTFGIAATDIVTAVDDGFGDAVVVTEDELIKAGPRAQRIEVLGRASGAAGEPDGAIR